MEEALDEIGEQQNTDSTNNTNKSNEIKENVEEGKLIENIEKGLINATLGFAVIHILVMHVIFSKVLFLIFIDGLYIYTYKLSLLKIKQD